MYIHTYVHVHVHIHNYIHTYTYSMCPKKIYISVPFNGHVIPFHFRLLPVLHPFNILLPLARNLLKWPLVVTSNGRSKSC